MTKLRAKAQDLTSHLIPGINPGAKDIFTFYTVYKACNNYINDINN